MMNQKIEAITLYLNALSLRERILVLLVLLTVIYAIWDSVIQRRFDQEYQTLQNLQLQIRQDQQDRDAKLAQDTALLIAKKQTIKQTQQRMNEAQDSLKQTQVKLDTVFDTLVPPNKITELLRSFLVQTNGLTLVSLNNEAAKNITPKSDDSDEQQTPETARLKTSLYEHAATIKLSGNYQQLYQYLLSLESSKWGLFWDQLQYKVTDYPLAEITLRVHTISTDEHWIGM